LSDELIKIFKFCVIRFYTSILNGKPSQNDSLHRQIKQALNRAIVCHWFFQLVGCFALTQRDYNG